MLSFKIESKKCFEGYKNTNKKTNKNNPPPQRKKKQKKNQKGKPAKQNNARSVKNRSEGTAERIISFFVAKLFLCNFLLNKIYSWFVLV